jgi:hypothetical protein
MNRFKLSYHIERVGEYGATEIKYIDLYCRLPYKCIGRVRYKWVRLESVYERNIGYFYSETELLNMMKALWLEYREKSRSERIKQKILKRLDYI